MATKPSLLLSTLKVIRPLQWLKNVVMFAPLIFSGLLFASDSSGMPYFVTTLYAAIIFCILASSVYILNDIIDIEADRAHPFKRKRPIASGALSVRLALFLCMLGIVVVFVLSYPLASNFFKLLILGYLALQVVYSLWLKHVPIFDVLSIAGAFIIRVYAGASVAAIRLNSWFLLTVISVSLFIAVCKRQSERNLFTNDKIGSSRQTLKRYNPRLLDQFTSMFATATWLSYALFTFQYQFVRPEQNLSILYPALPRILRPEKLLMLTIPVAIVGIMRYLQLIYEKNEGESPARVLVTDKVLLSVALLFTLMIVFILYAPAKLNDMID
ncbi:UbiA prenyltransferase family protein [bacterium]|nr:UbiA prenyltransferase family protein [bacterium]